MKRSVLIYLLSIALMGSSLEVGSARAADPCSSNVTVTNANDNGPGSLRQAIADVCSGGIIVFDGSLSGGRITLGATLFIDKDLTIDGSTLASKISIDGNNSVTVFEVLAHTTLDSLIITNGKTTDSAYAGGVSNSGRLLLLRGIITDNAGVDGGGIKNTNFLEIRESIISENTADNVGGGVMNYGELLVEDSVFLRNQASKGGGIYDEFGTIEVEDVLFSENAAMGSGFGGAISAVFGSLILTNSRFVDNSARSGGAIDIQSGLLDIRNSTLTDNSADTGGAINTNTATSIIVNSTFSGNSATNGGAIYNGFGMDVFNSTFFDNQAINDGGGINNSSTLSVTNSTFSGNSSAFGGGISNFGNLRFSNTILANSISGDDCYSPSLAGARVELNLHNLVETSPAAANQCGVPLIAADPRLGILKDNGGASETMALLPGSPALGVGDPATCAEDPQYNLDQRGMARPQGDPNCDIGAYESSLLTDLIPPDPPFVTAPPAQINDTTPVISGVAEAGSQINVWYLMDAGAPVPVCENVPVNSSGEWSCSSSVALSEGNIELAIHAIDEAGNQGPDTSHVFDVDLTLPSVVSILPVDESPTVEDEVEFRVVFSEPVRNASESDFALYADPRVRGASIEAVSGSGNLYAVTVSTGSGNGRLSLGVPVESAIKDLAGNNLGNLPFVTVDAYTIKKPANVAISIHEDLQGSYTMLPGAGARQSYNGVNRGPLKVASTNSVALLAAERLIYKVNGVPTSFTEMMGLPDNQLDSTYWLPWYNNAELDTQLRFANVSASPATVTVTIGDQQMGDPIPLAAGESTRVSFEGVNAGPVKIVSTHGVPIVAAERLLYKAAGKNTSFTEMMALPDNALDTVYWLPWYNNKDLDTQLRLANVSGTSTQVHVYIGGEEMQGSPFTLPAGESTRKSFPGINDGPVKIVSDQNLVLSERLIYKVNKVATSFTEMMALPNHALDTTYWLPWYNNKDLDTQLRFANVHDTQTATIHVYIGGDEMKGSPFTLLPGESTRQSFPNVNNGPVQIVSDVPLVAAERLIFKVNNVATSFTEMMALPDSQLDTTCWFPWYNNADLDTQLRFGVP